MLHPWRGNLAGVNILETAPVKGKMGLFSTGPDPAELLCYQQSHRRKTWARSQVPVKTLAQPSSCTLTAVGMAGRTFRAFNKHHHRR